jgi:hypothetical protein
MKYPSDRECQFDFCFKKYLKFTELLWYCRKSLVSRFFYQIINCMGNRKFLFASLATIFILYVLMALKLNLLQQSHHTFFHNNHMTFFVPIGVFYCSWIMVSVKLVMTLLKFNFAKYNYTEIIRNLGIYDGNVQNPFTDFSKWSSLKKNEGNLRLKIV